MKDLTFEQLPTAISQLFEKLEAIEQLLKKQTSPSTNELKDKLLTVQEAAEFLNLSVPTVYSKVSKSQLPVMKRAKRLYFSQKELLEYLQAGRKKTLSELEAQANDYIKQNKS